MRPKIAPSWSFQPFRIISARLSQPPRVPWAICILSPCFPGGFLQTGTSITLSHNCKHTSSGAPTPNPHNIVVGRITNSLPLHGPFYDYTTITPPPPPPKPCSYNISGRYVCFPVSSTGPPQPKPFSQARSSMPADMRSAQRGEGRAQPPPRKGHRPQRGFRV